MKCPKCEYEMKHGWLAIFNPILWLNFVVWQPMKPGWLRFFTPPEAEKVIVPDFGGKGCPKAYICKECKTVTFSYADDQLD
ncbi:PF20097 family protein [Verrucomicrobia bacterium]|jgi:hypothetical protein|nr:hypothetical protein [Verrucomicrobiota bacterium]MDA7657382.1 PF20097 family protein [Verrucomicrobiota bacterium]